MTLAAAFPDLLPPPAVGIFRVRLATEPWELRGCARLRREVFCDEQGLFTGSDLDEHDQAAQPIAAVSYAMGMADDVVGTVRIYEQPQGVWFGSRLAVARDWRGASGLSSGLIRAAVCTAHSRGCRKFLATVQRQNVPIFRRLHWRTLQEVDVCGRPHHLMQADLAFYPPAEAEPERMKKAFEGLDFSVGSIRDCGKRASWTDAIRQNPVPRLPAASPQAGPPANKERTLV